MVVGVCKVRLGIPEIGSLKEKRSVVKRVLARVRATFEVAIAEVEHNDVWKTSTVGIAAVGNDARFVNSVLDKVVDFIRELYLAEVEDHEIEIMHL